MKKIILVLSLFVLVGCNRQLIDLNYRFTYAKVIIGNEVEIHKIRSWKDFPEGDQIQITLENGTTILTHSTNVILYSEKP